MSTPKIPTKVTDKNGVLTTRYKNAEHAQRNSRIAGIGLPGSADGMSNLEMVLRSAPGINIIVRNQLIKAYGSDNGKVEIRAILDANEDNIDLTLLPTLHQLAENEDAEIGNLPVSKYGGGRVVDMYSEDAAGLTKDLTRDIENLSMLDHDRILSYTNSTTTNPILKAFRADVAEGEVTEIGSWTDWDMAGIGATDEDRAEAKKVIEGIPSNRSTVLKKDVLQYVSDEWMAANKDVETTTGFGAFYDRMEQMAANSPEQDRQGWDIALNRIRYYCAR